MATLNSSVIASAYTAGPAGNRKTAYASYSALASLAVADVINMVRVPAGAVILGCTLKATDIDTNGTPTIVLDVGDVADPDRLIDGATVGQAGGTSDALVSATGQFYEYAAETIISVTVQVGAATAAAGTIELAVDYIVGN